MVRKTYTSEQIISKLREAEIHVNQRMPIAEASRKISITEQTYYRWRKEYGGFPVTPINNNSARWSIRTIRLVNIQPWLNNYKPTGSDSCFQ